MTTLRKLARPRIKGLVSFQIENDNGVIRNLIHYLWVLSHVELARKLAALEKKDDAQFKVVFDAIRQLMAPPSAKRRSIGFHAEEKKSISFVLYLPASSSPAFRLLSLSPLCLPFIIHRFSVEGFNPAYSPLREQSRSLDGTKWNPGQVREVFSGFYPGYETLTAGQASRGARRIPAYGS